LGDTYTKLRLPELAGVVGAAAGCVFAGALVGAGVAAGVQAAASTENIKITPKTLNKIALFIWVSFFFLRNH
jgi:hypothetical protein